MSLDLEALLDELADRVAARLRPALAPPSGTVDAPGPLLMRRKDYAARVALSVRALDSRLPADAYAGAGRMRRVIVTRADAVLLGATPSAIPGDEPADPVARLARATARGSLR